MNIEDKIKLHQQLGREIVEYYQKEDGVNHLTLQAKVVPIDIVEANDYNPNQMPSKEMALLWDCIKIFGFLFPDLAWWDEKKQKYIIIDGFHRYETLRRSKKRFISIVELDINQDERMLLTVLMNRIKGMHKVEDMSKLVVELNNLGLSDIEIAKRLGMEPEEYIRLKQQLGIASYYRYHQYSKSWEIKMKAIHNFKL